MQNDMPLESEIDANAGERVTSRTSFKLKPDTYDGSTSLREFLSQFNLIARANRWDQEIKTSVIVSCLRGKARAVLENI